MESGRACTAPKFVAPTDLRGYRVSRGSAVLVDHAAEYFAALHRCAERHEDRLVVVGWSLMAGLVRPRALGTGGSRTPGGT